jgi:kinesin family protein 1
MFGANHLYIFRNPAEAVSAKLDDVDTTWDEAQDEIARGQGFATEHKNLANLTQAERDHMILQDEIVRMVPLVAEANSVAEELKKPVTFEVKLVNKTLAGGKFKTEVAVIVKNPTTSQSWMWASPKFMNRVFLFREMYQTYVQEGMDAIKRIPQDQDPFWEPEEPVLIGNGFAYLNPLAYGIEFEGQVHITDYKGKEEGLINMTIHPMTKEASDPSQAEFTIEDPSELVGKPMFVRIHIESGRGFNPKFQKGIHVRFRWGDSPDAPEIISPVIKGTSNPDFKFVHVVKIPTVDKKMIDYFENQALTVSVYGDQDNKAGAGKVAIASGSKGGKGDAEVSEITLTP